MPFTYSPEYRAMVLEQVRAGKLASELAVHLEVSEATIHRWKAQDDVDSGRRPGRSTTESAELRAARQRIAELETELAATKRASELFDEGRWCAQKRSTRSSPNSPSRGIAAKRPFADHVDSKCSVGGIWNQITLGRLASARGCGGF